MNQEEIKQLIPHRDAMLLVEDLTRTEEGEAVGHYHVRGDEFFLQGHFPGNPIVPGVILCEMVAQSAAALFGEDLAGKTPVYTGIREVKFRMQVKPGDTVEMRCRLERVKKPFYFILGGAYVNGKLAMEGAFSFAAI